jgi:hypothetical protein
MASDDGRAQVQLGKDTLARRRRDLGEDHPDTLTAAFSLVCELTELGEYQAAKELNEDILDRRRRVLGDRHPDTAGSAAFASS